MGSHDKLFKAVFSEPANAIAHFERFLPAELTTTLDMGRARLVPGSFVDEAFSERHTDLLYSVPWQHQAGDDVRKVLVYVLFEHQSSVDWKMTFRMAGYSVRIWDRWMRKHPDRRLLPPILPLVLYHGEQGWTAATELQGLLDLEGVEPSAVDALRPYLPNLRILVNELGKVPDEMLPRVPVVQQTLLLFKWGRHPDMLEYLRAWQDGLRAVADQDMPGLRILRLFVQYMLQVNDHVTEAALMDFLAPLGEDVKELPMSIGQQLREEGLKEGLQKGLQEGREALLQTARRLLARGMAPAEVAEATALPLEEVQALTH
jgi:Putative transposase, YhgA-like